MTWFKVQTWWRIKRRMTKEYAAQVYLFFELPFKIIVNWAFFLTTPAWLWFFLMITYLERAWQSHKNVERKVLKGEIWFFEQWKVY